LCATETESLLKPEAQHGFDLRAIPPSVLREGATVHGFQISTRLFRAQKFNTEYQIYAAQPIAPALIQLRRVRLGLFVFVPVGLALAGAAGYWYGSGTSLTV